MHEKAELLYFKNPETQRIKLKNEAKINLSKTRKLNKP